MIILGIDPGLAHTGWGVIETRGSVSRARAYGCVATPSDAPLDRRLGQIFDEIEQAIATYCPTDVAIEKIFFGENQRSAIATAHARGAAIVACSRYGLALGEYTPMQIKQAVVGTGSADKRQVIFMVRNILALDHDPRPDHCADALAAAVCHANLKRTQGIARSVATVAVAAQERAAREYLAQERREETAAATAARRSIGRTGRSRDRDILTRTRQSRRNSK
ncbi:MAG: crossover junction endodeoxyribonuclease RuvC [Atopobiaceae bacterium]|jgi:crossover junction endodeoxyribonuclease RuvC